MIFALVIAALCVICDIVTKYLAVMFIDEGETRVIIDGFLNFTYIKNEGMAFGLLSDKRYVFLIASTVMLIALIVFLFCYRKKAPTLLKVACGLIIGGGIGNMIDRIRLGYVVDFIDVRLFSFWKWIFNFADSCVCVGAALLVLYLIIDAVKTKKQNRENEYDDGDYNDTPDA